MIIDIELATGIERLSPDRVYCVRLPSETCADTVYDIRQRIDAALAQVTGPKPVIFLCGDDLSIEDITEQIAGRACPMT
jgi:hypothetical protein